VARKTNPRISLWRIVWRIVRIVMGTVGVLLVAAGSALGALMYATFHSGDYGAQGAGFPIALATFSVFFGILFVLAAVLPLRASIAMFAAVGAAIVVGTVSASLAASLAASLGFFALAVALAIALGAGILVFNVTYRTVGRPKRRSP
jgi:hypothetical protein